MVVHHVPVVVRQLEWGLCVRDGVWGLGLTPARWCVPTVGHNDIIVIVWHGNHGGLVHRPVALVGMPFEFGVGGWGWELVSMVSCLVLLLNLLLYLPLSADALVVDLLSLLWVSPSCAAAESGCMRGGGADRGHAVVSSCVVLSCSCCSTSAPFWFSCSPLSLSLLTSPCHLLSSCSFHLASSFVSHSACLQQVPLGLFPVRQPLAVGLRGWAWVVARLVP